MKRYTFWDINPWSVEIQPTFGGEHIASIFKAEEQAKEETIMKLFASCRYVARFILQP
jgi:hypothetical protein